MSAVQGIDQEKRTYETLAIRNSFHLLRINPDIRPPSRAIPTKIHSRFQLHRRKLICLFMFAIETLHGSHKSGPSFCCYCPNQKRRKREYVRELPSMDKVPLGQTVRPLHSPIVPSQFWAPLIKTSIVKECRAVYTRRVRRCQSMEGDQHHSSQKPSKPLPAIPTDSSLAPSNRDKKKIQNRKLFYNVFSFYLFTLSGVHGVRVRQPLHFSIELITSSSERTAA
mmetsp:Transcript_32719/g.128543  ORF Transcript_32719/g.128543 Transcript_32719/m.128543 type:complete len:224 (+) Transcript_32719:699-1370(+)